MCLLFTGKYLFFRCFFSFKRITGRRPVKGRRLGGWEWGNCEREGIRRAAGSGAVVFAGKLPAIDPLLHDERISGWARQGIRTILPNVLASMTAWCAVAASVNGSSRLTTGRSVPLASPSKKAQCMLAISFSLAL